MIPPIQIILIQLLLLLILSPLLTTQSTTTTKIVTIPLQRKPFHNNNNKNNRRILDHDTVAFKEVARTKREGDGVYFTTLKIGTPLQTFTVILDTGSSTIAVPCTGCSCGNHHQFDYTSSSSYREVGSYNQCYSEGSCNTGKMLSDVACFGEQCVHNETVRHNFGCCRQYAKAFQEQDADGIVGLSNAQDTLIANLRQHHDLKANIFAVCFGRFGGSLTVGGTSLDPLLEDPVWVPLLNTNNVFYSVDISSFIVNGVSIMAPSGGSSSQRPIIDSGSSFTYVYSGVHNGMKQAFDTFCSSSDGTKCRGTRNPPGTVPADIRDSIACFAPPSNVVGTDQNQIDTWLTSDFPTLEIEFSGGKRICISPRSYFWLSSPSVNSWCVGIFPDVKIVIGAISMAEFTVIFDADKRRVGWARSDCDGDGKTLQICCGNGKGGTCGIPPLPYSKNTIQPTTLHDDEKQQQQQENTGVPSASSSLSSSSSNTSSPTHEPKPKGFWDGNTRLVSAYFFILGIFFAAFISCGWWYCCAKRNQVSFKPMNQVEPIQEYDSDLADEDDDEEMGEDRRLSTSNNNNSNNNGGDITENNSVQTKHMNQNLFNENDGLVDTTNNNNNNNGLDS
jgi:hypothetical protein